MKILTSLLFVFLFIVGCKKEKMWFNDTTITATVLDSATFEPVKNLEIKLYRNKTVGMIFPSQKEVTIKTRYTDDNGTFKIKFNRVKGRIYYLDFDINNNWDYDFYLNSKRIYTDELDIDTLIKYAPLIYRVKD